MRESKLIKLVGKYGIYGYVGKGKRKKLARISPSDLVYSFDYQEFIFFESATYCDSYYGTSESIDGVYEFEDRFSATYFNQLWTLDTPKYVEKFKRRNGINEIK